MKLKYSDKVHGYWLDGKRCKGVSSVAKLPDETFGLDQWRKRQVAIGLAKAPHLLESVAAHHTDNGKLNELCEEALVVAGASDAAHSGTAAHRVTERIDAGESLIMTPKAKIIAATWQGALDAAGLEIVGDLVERIVVFPDERICGKFDRVVRRKRDGALAVIDLKTGTSAVKYPHSVATQMAMYANAPLIAGEWSGIDGETEEFTPLPDELDKRLGYMVHMPNDGGFATVYSVNLQLGWECVQQIIFPALRWRAVTPSRLIKAVA